MSGWGRKVWHNAFDVSLLHFLYRIVILIYGSLQKNVDLPDTFEPTNLSLPKGLYKMMVETMHLPHHWIETSSCVGPFFWSTMTEVDGRPHFRKL
jgi:hypothetical protein